TGCEPLVASAAGGTTRVVVTCVGSDATTSARLVTLDDGTGRELGSRRLPVESPVDTVMVVSADPFTLLLKERDARGVAAVLAYPGTGTGTGDPVEIPLSGSEEDLAVVPASDAFAARPALLATVGDGSVECTARLLRADDTWIVVNSDGDSRPPILGVRG